MQSIQIENFERSLKIHAVEHFNRGWQLSPPQLSGLMQSVQALAQGGFGAPVAALCG